MQLVARCVFVHVYENRSARETAADAALPCTPSGQGSAPNPLHWRHLFGQARTSRRDRPDSHPHGKADSGRAPFDRSARGCGWRDPERVRCQGPDRCPRCDRAARDHAPGCVPGAFAHREQHQPARPRYEHRLPAIGQVRPGSHEVPLRAHDARRADPAPPRRRGAGRRPQ